MRERAALLHGRLDIVGEPTTGTTVRLEVPLRPGHERAAEQVRVLLVEDHTAVREAIAGMLERESDLTVVGQAESLAEARELLHGVDVAVLDLALPDGDAIALIPELRAASPGAQVLVLSANLDRARPPARSTPAPPARSTRPPTSTRSAMPSGAYARAKPCWPATRSPSCSASPATAASRSARTVRRLPA